MDLSLNDAIPVSVPNGKGNLRGGDRHRGFAYSSDRRPTSSFRAMFIRVTL